MEERKTQPRTGLLFKVGFSEWKNPYDIVTGEEKQKEIFV